MKRLSRMLALAGIALAAYPLYAAPTDSGAGHINFMGGGWTGNQVRVQLANVPFTNPSSCPRTDGYMTDPATAGVDLFNSMLLSAYMASKRVKLTVDGCHELRPKIIGVVILPD